MTSNLVKWPIPHFPLTNHHHTSSKITIPKAAKFIPESHVTLLLKHRIREHCLTQPVEYVLNLIILNFSPKQIPHSWTSFSFNDRTVGQVYLPNQEEMDLPWTSWRLRSGHLTCTVMHWHRHKIFVVWKKYVNQNKLRPLISFHSSFVFLSEGNGGALTIFGSWLRGSWLKEMFFVCDLPMWHAVTSVCCSLS